MTACARRVGFVAVREDKSMVADAVARAVTAVTLLKRTGDES